MIADDVHIRVAMPIDTDSILDIWREGIEGAGFPSAPGEAAALTAFRERVAAPQGESRLWVAVANGEVIGWQGLLDLGTTWINRAALSSTYVSKAWRGKRLGGELLRNATVHAAETSFDYVTGWINVNNRVAIQAVERLGWEFVGVIPRAVRTVEQYGYWVYVVPHGNLAHEAYGTNDELVNDSERKS